MASKKLTLITGGSRSGKSARAVALAMEYPADQRFFLATAEALDEEMRARIECHRHDRAGAFETIEEPIQICAALEALETRAAVVVLDCLTLWIANLMGRGLPDQSILEQSDQLATLLKQTTFSAIVVTDEVGWGIVPENPVARRFRDLLGWTNQKIAEACARVILMVAGQSLTLK